jgi:hypothetical protein
MKKYHLLLSVFALLILFGCKKPSAEKLYTELKGNVLLFDEGITAIDKSGVKVSIEDSNPVVSSTSNNMGDFVLNVNTSLQSFTLVYSKPGMGTFKRLLTRNPDGSFNILNPDNTTVPSFQVSESLGSKSTAVVNSLQAVVNKDTLIIKCNVSSSNLSGEKCIRLLYQKNLADISISNVDKTRLNWSHNFLVKNGDNTITLCMKCSSVCADWNPGDKIYFTAYGDSYYTNVYIDHLSNTLTLPNLNPNSLAVPCSIVMP